MNDNIETIATFGGGLPRKYGYHAKDLKEPILSKIAEHWGELEVGDVRVLPGTVGKNSDSDMCYFRRWFIQHMMLRGYRIGVHFGLMRDPNSACIKFIKLG